MYEGVLGRPVLHSISASMHVTTAGDLAHRAQATCCSADESANFQTAQIPQMWSEYQHFPTDIAMPLIRLVYLA